ncbi:hypothetical protein GQ55_7G225600 [Panicum hallii var. hallii]|uniref:Uncharacterized protein n=1 Tax=Panicum hallii var. hallii TaxID=1504633 RepID=A0A2T7CXZ8_9POAL|nr:hypothetical protein GQ55_7G225600 [Panicum hallii var. hallii]
MDGRGLGTREGHGLTGLIFLSLPLIPKHTRQGKASKQGKAPQKSFHPHPPGPRRRRWTHRGSTATVSARVHRWRDGAVIWRLSVFMGQVTWTFALFPVPAGSLGSMQCWRFCHQQSVPNGNF